MINSIWIAIVLANDNIHNFEQLDDAFHFYRESET